ncbi:hypothetical protein NW757_013952 [Fusarium falciforme]|nr:hypothetical protein NW757_013952 [Fusarium falciforme]
MASQKSEQLPFKDFYSQNDIRPGDRVTVLWMDATDVFFLERGDMFKIVGIWDDDLAMGEEYNAKLKVFQTFCTKFEEAAGEFTTGPEREFAQHFAKS